MGNNVRISTCALLELQPIRGKPFLVGSDIAPCHNINKITTSVRVQECSLFRLDQIARNDYKTLKNNEDSIEEFL